MTCRLNLQFEQKSYNAIRSNNITVRDANKIDSALISIWNAITDDHSTVSTITLCSDSCLAQSQTFCVRFVFKRFMCDNPHIQRVDQTFCTLGHSSIQEVDNNLSYIEKGLSVAVRPNDSKYIQMKSNSFCNYQTATKVWNSRDKSKTYCHKIKQSDGRLL